MTFVVGLSGPIAVGKTAIATLLADQLQVPRASFGDTVRRTAADRGLPTDRRTLQDLGEQLIAAGWAPFCTAVLAQGGWRPGQSLVIDGIRHLQAIVTLEKLVHPAQLRLVFLEASAETRQQRLTERESASPLTTAVVDSHRSERELDQLREAAHLVISNIDEPQRIATAILEFISSTAG